jgi:cytochrome d ubiquinol oxidase subunit II
LPAVFSHHGLRFLLAVISGITTETLLMSYRFLWVQIAAAGTVTLTITGFAAAIYPDLLIGQLALTTAAAAPSATLRAFFSLLVIGIIILAPSLLLLYWTFRGEPNPELPG